MKEIIVNKTYPRLDNYLSDNFPLLNIGNLNKFLRQSKIKLNGKKPSLSDGIKKGDVLKLYLEDMFFEKPTPATAFKFSGKSLDILFEDENLLIVNKPSGVSVYDENWQNFDTLVNRVSNHYHLLNQPLAYPIQLCHRLDTGTQGLVILAKNPAALNFMTELFKDRNLKKEYLCVVNGLPKFKHSIQRAFLAKNSKEGYVTVSDKAKNDLSKPIETEITLIESYADYSLLKIDLLTGRTHQIRAHLSFLGLPILGDSRYGINALNRRLRLKYQALCSAKITFGNIENEHFSYLSGKEFVCPTPWFVDSFYNREFK